MRRFVLFGPPLSGIPNAARLNRDAGGRREAAMGLLLLVARGSRPLGGMNSTITQNRWDEDASGTHVLVARLQ
jgi:hypothetical protein